MDLACLIPGSSGNNWGGERMCFEDNCMNFAYKYHKPIELSQEWSKSYTWGLCMSQRQLWIYPSAICYIQLQVDGTSTMLRYETIHMFSFFSLRWGSRQGCFSAGSIRLKVLNPIWNLLRAWTSSLWVRSFDHPVLLLLLCFLSRVEKLSCAITSPIPNTHKHTHTHIYFRPRGTLVSV